MSTLSVEDVRVEPDPVALVTAGIWQPGGDGAVGAPTFVVRGWVLGAAARVLAVEMRAGEKLVRVCPVREPTPEVAQAHPEHPRAAECGYLTRVHVGALERSSELRLEAVLADGTRAAIGMIALGRGERSRPPRRVTPAPPSIRPDAERLALREAERRGMEAEGLLAEPRIAALDEVGLEGRTVLDLCGGPGHVARAARARGAALVDSVHLDDELAGLARLLDLYHRTTRVFVHDSLAGLERKYDVVLAPATPSATVAQALESVRAPALVHP